MINTPQTKQDYGTRQSLGEKSSLSHVNKTAELYTPRGVLCNHKAIINHEERTLPTYQQCVEEWYR